MADRNLIGPLLYIDDVSDDAVAYAVLFIANDPSEVGGVMVEGTCHEPVPLAQFDEHVVLRARFSAPLGPFHYIWQGQRFDVAGAFRGDTRVAYASCNGEETGDLNRADKERNLLWARMRQQHNETPFSLLLLGGDQIYADEETKGHALSEDWPERIPRDPARADLQDLRHHLREGFLRRYMHLYAGPDLAWLSARIPSLMQWDDHDICDGWGSLQRSRTYSPVGQMIFEVAREVCLLFQHAAVDGDLPARFGSPDGDHLGWAVRLPGLHIVAPDLRGQRTRREVMGDSGWAFLEEALGSNWGDSVFLMSSVPVLGPRLSLFETLMTLIPKMQKYEDDLRDQWQSRAHRGSWTRVLRLIQEAGRERRVVALSGEIHMATRAEMPVAPGRIFHQLVSSGVTHRPPPEKWAQLLGWVATWGDAPVPGHRIAIKRLPGQKRRYVAERNTLSLAREDGQWSASWDLENSGRTHPLGL